MKLKSITANRHIFDDRVRGKPLRLLLNFDDGRSLRLHVAGDGERMITDGNPLDEPFDMGEGGRIDIGDVTQSLYPQLRDAEIGDVHALNCHGTQVGVTLTLADGGVFHFWVDGDELHWGDEAALTVHDWLDGLVPGLGDRFQIQCPLSTHSGHDRFRPIADISALATFLGHERAMVSTDALFRIADAAEERGSYELARQSFERGAALGDAGCLMRLAYMYDVGELGVPVDKVRAMQLYRRAWRLGCPGCASNIAILYREQGQHRAMFQWFKREADGGDGSAQLDLAKCYLNGTGVRKCAQTALRCLATAISSEYITEAEREEAQAIMDTLRPRSI